MTEIGNHKVIDLYDISNYHFGTKEKQPEKDKSVKARFDRMKREFPEKGCKRSVEAVLLVHKHQHPHALVLQIGNEHRGFFKLPGGKANSDESDEEAMMRKLQRKLGAKEQKERVEWTIGDCVSVWYRPNFDQPMFPYKLPHITQQKEVKKLFIVPLPEEAIFQVPQNFNFYAVPFFELYENSKTYGPIISSIPQLLSRYHFNYKT